MTPELLLQGGLRRALELAVERLNDAQEKLQCNLFTNLAQEPATDGRALALYRCFQELSNNVLRHAGATRLDVQLNSDASELQLIVEDNGKGFDPETAKGGLGIPNLRSRMEAYGGTLVIDSAPGHGTTAVLEFRLSAGATVTISKGAVWSQ
ncbi:MAG: hypothetical protein EOP50_08110 [Sphingobacteriales bacterium]|nr:MAG: hypothetical protein EOP50_08110 [Sphingobacteriales bacterium]